MNDALKLNQKSINKAESRPEFSNLGACNEVPKATFQLLRKWPHLWRGRQPQLPLVSVGPGTLRGSGNQAISPHVSKLETSGSSLSQGGSEQLRGKAGSDFGKAEHSRVLWVLASIERSALSGVGSSHGR